MAEVTEQDRAKARELIDTLEANYTTSTRDGMGQIMDDGIEPIALALAAAREQGYMSGFAACYREQKDAATRANSDAYSLISQAVHARGVLDCTDFERGPVVRKVLGSLPVTADGCVVAVHQWLFVPGHAGKFGMGPNLTVPYAVQDESVPGGWRYLRVDECYSTRAAAEAARPTP